MALNPLVDSRDVKFILFEMLQADKLSAYPQFAGFDRETYESTLGLAEQIAIERVYPANAAVDKAGGAHYDPATKNVTVPEAYK